jgi:transcriptional regulator with XRE-family HTH domain
MPQPEDVETHPAVPQIGAKLRAARRKKGMTIAQVAAEADLSNGFISLLERDEANASVAALLRLCNVLGLAIGALFEQPRSAVLKKADRETVNFGGYGIEDEVLTPRWERSLQVIESTIEPGGRSGDEPHSFQADAELVYVLRGSLDIEMPTGPIRLRTGDTFLLSPKEPHTWVNPSAKATATVLWIITPASL